ncbi:hypothetical protein SAMN05216331_12050 [Porphyromonadaceae bacterium KH3R12]|nr:hypothetical protein SAMN05216331_12050 [Porphyromonadaceae bacterium KH3R12]
MLKRYIENLSLVLTLSLLAVYAGNDKSGKKK